MTLRSILMTMIALAMTFAPIAIERGAMAMPVDHGGMAMDESHCGDQPAQDDGGKAAGDQCCAAMCTAIAGTPAPSLHSVRFARSIERPALDRFGRSFLAELPTPPPRRA